MDKQKATQIIKDAPVDCEYSKLEILKIEEGEEMKDKSYPYIGKCKHSGAVFLFIGECAALTMHQGIKSKYSTFEVVVLECLCTNITTEYLANTYGEVVSPEHAEFIIELAKNAGFSVSGLTARSMCFEFSGDCNVVFYEIPLDIFANNEESKKITIPLPPKQIQTATPEGEFEMTQIMKNAGDNLVLGCEDSKCDEWPKIGDEVLVYSSIRRLAEIKGKVVKVIGKCTHSDGDTILTVEHSSLGVFAVANGSWIQKPKTPEDELRDDIAKQLEIINDNHLSSCGSWIQSITDALLNNKISGLNITKKPQ